MKKYLMTGIAALALSAGFTSCSHDIEPMTQEEINQIEAQKIIKTYEQAFIKTFGQPAANQNWGFGAANTRGVDADGNHWAASDYGKWKVPPVLKPEQIAAVVEYFQTVKKPSYQDPQWTNYFIQQVYKGGYSPREGYSPEEYTAANGSTKIVGSDHMDHLAAIDPDAEGGEFVDHNNNFNHGDCGVYGNVLAYEEGKPHSANDTQYQYPDKINLMVNSTTKSFGYYNSNSSVRRTEYTGLVSYQTIIDELGEEKAGCLRDGWNRSFMGFDFEMLADREMYSTTKYDANGNIVWSGEYDHEVINYFSVSLNGQDEVWDGTKLVAANTIGEVVKDQWGNKNLYPYMPGTTEKVPLLSENKNMYSGTPDSHNWSDADWQYTYSNNGQNTVYTSVAEMLRALNDYMLPTNNKSWVKIGGTADGYYSDWIVTLTEAKQYDTDTTNPGGGDNPGGGTTEETSNADLRIIAEDLSVGDGDEDFDFNDVVFDVYYGAANEAKAVILAAGGTLDLKVDGREVHALFGSQYAGKMINTNGTKNSDANVRAKSVDDLTPVEIPLTKEVWSPAQARDNIKVEVYKNGQWVELTAIEGKVASKVRVGTDYTWSDERTFVGDGFKAYVAGQANYNDWYVNVNE